MPDRWRRTVTKYRLQAEQVAAAVGATPAGIELLPRTVGVALGTKPLGTKQLGTKRLGTKRLGTKRLGTKQLGTKESPTGSKAPAARAVRLPYDRDRLRQFARLVTALRESAPQNRPVLNPRADRYLHLPFFEAYFSNFIEGTEFEIAEAVAVVYDGEQLPGRADDSHDLLGTYLVVSDVAEMRTLAATRNEFLRLLRSRHAAILAGRPEKSPGSFKDRDNRAGNTLFVAPDLVQGTLIEGWNHLGELDTAFERATYMMFVISEVHPFNDGNGRLARVMMNAELVNAGQSRIIIPTVYRDDYVGGLRRLTRHDDASVLIKGLRYGQDYTSQIELH